MIDIFKRFWIGHIVVIIGAIILANLGFWQLRRLDERRALNAEILAGLNAPVVTLTGQPVDPDDLHRHRVTLTGTFDNDESVVIENRPGRGRPGVEIVTPFQIAGSNAAVLVNRGWIPLDEREPAARRAYDLDGEVTIEGIAYRSQDQPTGVVALPDPTLAPGESRIDAWFRVDVERIGEQLEYGLLPIFVEQSPGADPDALPLREEDFDLSEGSHLSYAMQWFTFAVILVVVYFTMLWQEGRKASRTENLVNK